MKSLQAVTALGALAQESRLAAFRLLVKRGPAGFTPTQLAEKLGMAAPTLSFHLKGLQSAGLIDVRRAGRNLYYTADYPRMNALVQYLTQHCCALAEVACDTATCEPIEANLARSRRA